MCRNIDTLLVASVASIVKVEESGPPDILQVLQQHEGLYPDPNPVSSAPERRTVNVQCLEVTLE